MSDVLHVDSASWQTEVLDSDVPVLVDFWATWCGPCKAISPVLDELAAEADNKFKIVKVDVDQSQDLAAQFGVRSIPMLRHRKIVRLIHFCTSFIFFYI